MTFPRSLILLVAFVVGAAVHAEEGSTLQRPPIHRYSFNGEGSGPLTDSIGGQHGRVQIEMPTVLPFHQGSTTMVVLPDTEGYCEKRPHVFFRMMEWVAKESEARNIGSILHVGDVTNNNRKLEWRNARKAFDYVEGKLPYVLAAGNHDYDHTPGRLTLMNEYFKVDDQKKWPTFGDVYEPGKLENHYQFLSINGQKWIVLSLEMGPRKGVIKWANEVLAKHDDHLAIILTHGFLYYGNERYDHRKGGQRATPYNFYGEGADGEMLWTQLISKHATVMMVICGHLSSQYVGYRKDRGEHANMVHQMLVDYENMRGGNGFLRLLEFLPDGKRVQVRTYSPLVNEIRSPITKGENPKRDPKLEEFMFTLETAPGKEAMLQVDAPASTANSASAITAVVPPAVPPARLNGRGQFVIEANKIDFHQVPVGYGEFSPNLVKGRKRISIEAWVTPTSDAYNWDPMVIFKGDDDRLWYTFRTLSKHRAELIDNGHNEDIQRSVNVTPGEPLHLVMTYDETGRDGKPLISSFVNGRRNGEMGTGIKLSGLTLKHGRLGPFAGKYDELRIYDYPLSPAEVAGNFKAGPDILNAK